MNLHEVIGFPTHLGYPGSIIWSLSTLIAIFSYHCVCRALTSRPYPHTSRNNHVRLMVINFFSGFEADYRSPWVLPCSRHLGTSGVFPGASMATVSFDGLIFRWPRRGAEDLIKFCARILRRAKTCRTHCARTFLILNPSSTPSDLWEISKRGSRGCLVQMAWLSRKKRLKKD